MSETQTEQATETVELTGALLQALLCMTGEDADQDANVRALLLVLHRVQFVPGNRWKTELTERDMRTVVHLLEAYTLVKTKLRIRFDNYLFHRSELYRKVKETA